jgi:hypothetical protein
VIFKIYSSFNMDPLSLVALLGIAVAGRQIASSDRKEGFTPAPVPNRETQQLPFFGRNINTPGQDLTLVTDILSGPYVDTSKQKKEIVATLQDTSPNVQFPFGQPVYNLYDRQNVSSRMNNLSSAERRFVGPGIGVPANVPAYGGYQQQFRVMPNNVGAYKLTTLPGRSGPAKDFVNRGTERLTVTQNRPQKSYQLLGGEDRRPLERGRAQGQGGMLTGQRERERYVKTQRPTIRSETSTRMDGLEFGAAKKFVSAGTLQEAPTRNKANFQSRINDVAAPGIHSFEGAYQNTQNTILLRPADRGNKGYTPPGGRMNVRGSATQAQGATTHTRDSASTVIEGGAGNQYLGQNYDITWKQNNNAYKGNADFRTNNLGLAVKQLDNNPFALSLAQH